MIIHLSKKESSHYFQPKRSYYKTNHTSIYSVDKSLISLKINQKWMYGMWNIIDVRICRCKYGLESILVLVYEDCDLEEYCTILYCTVLYCNALQYTTLNYTVQYHAKLYYTEICHTILYCTMLYCKVLWCSVRYYDLLWRTVLYHTTL